jgi:predicted ABC-type ATPase
MAVDRVRDRVLAGGHQVPEDVVRRRYEAGLRNFVALYRPLATSWQFLDNSVRGDPRPVAAGAVDRTTDGFDAELWNNVDRTWR